MRETTVQVTEVPLSSLKAYDNNAKQHDNANIEAIANSIDQFGFRQPILAWHNDDGIPEIVAGHGRAAAAKKLGMEAVPVVFVDDLDDAQRRMLTHADNQTTLMTGWDYGTLNEELDSLGDLFDVSDFGFNVNEAEFLDEQEPNNVDISNTFGCSLVVKFDDESECERLFEELNERGFSCQVSTL